MQIQLHWIETLQQLTGLAGPMQLFSFLGNEQFFLLLIPIVYLCIDAGLGVRLALIVLFSDSLCYYLKILCHQPRPYWIETGRVLGLDPDGSYGLPSSHAQNATAVWLFLAKQAKRAWALPTAIAIILLISISRVYLGAHFPTDVLGGWVVGIAFLALFLKTGPAIKKWISGSDLSMQVVGSLGAAAFLVLLAFIVRDAVATSTDPAAWGKFPDDPRGLSPIVGHAGAITGLGLGVGMAMKRARFRSDGPLHLRLARLTIGLMGVGFFYVVLSNIILLRDNEFADQMVRFARYALLTWWVTFLTPWMCLKLKLAEPAPEHLP